MSFYTSTPPAASCSESRPRSPDCAPADFDPGAHPILARHWFGIEPPRSTGQVAGEVVANLRRQRQIEHVHRLGPRNCGAVLPLAGARAGP